MDKHLIVFCDDAQWKLLCEIMNQWLLPKDKKSEVYEKASDITIWFKRGDIPLVMERLVIKVWRIPPSEFRVVWRHRYPQV